MALVPKTTPIQTVQSLICSIFWKIYIFQDTLSNMDSTNCDHLHSLHYEHKKGSFILSAKGQTTETNTTVNSFTKYSNRPNRKHDYIPPYNQITSYYTTVTYCNHILQHQHQRYYNFNRYQFLNMTVQITILMKNL